MADTPGGRRELIPFSGTDGPQEALDISAAIMAPEGAPGAPAPLALVGREADMAALDDLLAANGVCVITETASAGGQGGIGKTWLARAYAARQEGRFPNGSCVLPLDRPDRAGVALAAYGLRWGLAVDGDFQRRLQVIFEDLRAHAGVLLILDDCGDAASVQTLRAQVGHVPILVTARRSAWAEAAEMAVYPVGPLDFGDATRLVVRDRPDLSADRPEPARIAAALDEVPAALDFAARTLAAERDGEFGEPLAYLAALRAVPVDRLVIAMDGLPRRPAGHERAIVRALAVAAGRLRPVHGPDITALALLRHAVAFIPGQAFPEKLLRQAITTREAAPDTPQVDQGIARLRNLGLLRGDAAMPGLYVPPLVAAYVAGADPEAVGGARRCVERVVAARVQDCLIAGRVNEVLSWQVHLHHITEMAEGTQSPAAPVLFRRLADQMDALGEAAHADRLRQRGEALASGS